METSEVRLVDWQKIPDDVLIRIFSFLPARNLLYASETCKDWYRVAYDELLWKDLFYRKWQIDTAIPRALGKSSWQGEYKRLYYHTPALESEVIHQHNDQVLHVSFAHNGTMFSTSSKDGHIKVWTASYPVTLKFQQDMKSYTWKYTQFSQFNQSDTLLLVSGVHFGASTTSGEIAVFSVTDRFELQCRVMNKPYDVFGTWYNESYLLSGSLSWLGELASCSTLWLNKAFQAVESEQESVVMRLFRFHNVNASSIRTIMIANCWNGTAGPAEGSTDHLTGPMKTIGSRPLEPWPCQHRELQTRSNVVQTCPGSQRMQNMTSIENGEFRSNLLEVDTEEVTTKLNGTIEYQEAYRQAENASEESRVAAVEARDAEMRDSSDERWASEALPAGREAKLKLSLSGNQSPESACSPSKQQRPNVYPGIGSSSDVFHAGSSASGSNSPQMNSHKTRHRSPSHHAVCIGESSSPCDHLVDPPSQFSQLYCDKFLIFTTGSLTYTPHQIGIKRIQPLEKEFGARICKTEHGVRLLPNVDENIPNNAEYSTVDKLINLHGHIIGMSLSPDHRYLYVNNRPWPKNYRIDNPLLPPPIAQEIDIHVIDLVHLKEVGTMHRSHKAYTPNDECFFIFLDVCDEYVVSGAEDRHGYLWDRHYGLCLQKFKHQDVVNAVAFNPQDREMVVSVSDDASIKIWRSRNREEQVKQQSISKMEYETGVTCIV